MKTVETYTSEQINNAKKLAQIIVTTPDNKKAIIVAVVNAYLDGFMAGNSLDEDIGSQINAI